jgi:hypothetical protein
MASSIDRWAVLGVALLAAVSAGYSCNPRPAVVITSPPHGTFTTDPTVTIQGELVDINNTLAQVTVNGVPVNFDTPKTWSITLPLDSVAVVNPFTAKLTRTSDGKVFPRKRIVVMAGNSVPDGDFSLESVALRLSDWGLDQIEPLVTSLVNLDIASLLPVGTLVVNDYCAIYFLGCLGRVDVVVASPPPTLSSFGINVDSMTNFAAGDVTVNNIKVQLDVIGSGLAPSCGLEIKAVTTHIYGDYALQPDSVDPSNIDVNLIGAPIVAFQGFESHFTSGLCDFPLIGDLIQLIIGDVQPVVVSGLQDFLDDPDGAGPADAPIADAVEMALSAISITGPIGEALQVDMEAPLFDVAEDVDGITLGSDSRIQSSVGTGPGQCTPPAGAPDLPASYHVDEAFPSFGPTTPVGGVPYDLGMSISTSAFNQLLKAQVECGLLRTSLYEFDFGGGPFPLSAAVLSLLVPEFASLPPDLPMRIDLIPTMAPILTGNAGPGGEIGELRMPQLIGEVRSDNFANTLYLRVAVDFKSGLDVVFNDETSSLEFQIGSLTFQDVTVGILDNNVNTNETILGIVLPQILALVLPDLGAGLGDFPLPAFLGLQLQGLEVAKSGQFTSLFANLVPAP